MNRRRRRPRAYWTTIVAIVIPAVFIDDAITDDWNHVTPLKLALVIIISLALGLSGRLILRRSNARWPASDGSDE